MQDLIIYLFKSAGLMSLFFAGYFFLLKNDTSFRANRFFLLAGILTSLFLPFLEITRTITVERTATSTFLDDLSAIPFSAPTAQSTDPEWWLIAGIVYLIGFTFLFLKFFLELFSLLNLICTHKVSREGDFFIIRKAGSNQPFSFFKIIVFDPEQHSPTELELILKHERSHARQWHSVDQLLTSLSVYLLWFNPLAWQYRKSVVQNLEYLADQEVIAAQVSKREYQKTLLKISVASFQPALTNQFYQSFIKKRIMMLNTNTTQKSNFWKTSLLLPFLFFFMVSFNFKTKAQVLVQDKEKIVSTSTEVEENQDTPRKFKDVKIISENDDIPAIHLENDKMKTFFIQETKPLIIIEGEEQDKDFDVSSINPTTIKSLNVLKKEDAVKKYGKRAKNGVIEIHLLSKEEMKSTTPTSEEKVKPVTIRVSNAQFDDAPKKSATISVRDVGNAQAPPSDALYILDGKEMAKEFDPQSIPEGNIDSITVLKGDKATTKYGEKAKKGAIEISTKE